jgi:hypothetical protein
MNGADAAAVGVLEAIAKFSATAMGAAKTAVAAAPAMIIGVRKLSAFMLRFTTCSGSQNTAD